MRRAPRVEERAALGEGDHRDGAVAAGGGEGGSVERIDLDSQHRRTTGRRESGTKLDEK